MSIERAAAQLLQFLPTGRFAGIPIQNLRIALSAAFHRSDGTYVEAIVTLPATYGEVPVWAWKDQPMPSEMTALTALHQSSVAHESHALQPEAATLFECELMIVREGSKSGQQEFEMKFSGDAGGQGVAYSAMKLYEFISMVLSDRSSASRTADILDLQERVELSELLVAMKGRGMVSLRPFVAKVVVRRVGDKAGEHGVELSGSRTFVAALKLGQKMVSRIFEQAEEIQAAILAVAPT